MPWDVSAEIGGTESMIQTRQVTEADEDEDDICPQVSLTLLSSISET